MIARLFRATLEKAGVKPMDAVGKPFDPSLHQAVAQVDSPGGPDHVVLEEIQKGYLLEGRVLRAAMVKVSRASSPEAAYWQASAEATPAAATGSLGSSAATAVSFSRKRA